MKEGIVTEIDKLEKIVDLQLKLLLRVCSSLGEDDQRDIVAMQEQVMAILDGKIKMSKVKKTKRPADRSYKRKVTRQRGKERDREAY